MVSLKNEGTFANTYKMNEMTNSETCRSRFDLVVDFPQGV